MKTQTYTAADFDTLGHGALVMEAHFFVASVTYHATELAAAVEARDLIQAEQAKRAALEAVAA